MTYEEFKKEITNNIIEKVDPSFHVSIDQITKNNGLILDGLIIMNPERNISPTIYLNQYFGRYLDGVPFEDIIDDIYATYLKFMPKEDFDVSIISSFEGVQNSLIMKLINYEENIEFLSQIPHERYLDMAIIFQYVLNFKEQDYATITITNSLLSKWNIPQKLLLEKAKINTPRILPFTLDNILDYLPEYISNEEYKKEGQSLKMLVLTNSRKMYGATTLLYDGLLEKISESYEKDLILIPSSIHEVILIPADENEYPSLEYFNELINDVNSFELADDEILSSHAYYFSRKKCCLS